MSIKSTKLLIPIVIAATIAIVSLFVILNNESRSIESTAIKAVPIDASILIESKYTEKSTFLNSMLSENKIWKQLTKIQSFEDIESGFRLLDSLFSKSPEASQIFNNSSVLISTHIRGKNDVEFLFCAALQSRSNIGNVKDIIEELLTEDAIIKKRTYNNIKVYFITKRFQTFYFLI